MGARLCPTPVIAGADAKRFFEVTNEVVISDKMKTLAAAVLKATQHAHAEKKK